MIDLTPYQATRALWSKGLLLIKLRWAAFAGAVGVVVIGLATGGLEGLVPFPMAIVAGILGGSNLLFHPAHVALHRKGHSERRARIYNLLFAAQVLADYSSVTILIFAAGFSSANLAFLYLPHVILTGLVCERRRMSLTVTLVALGLIYWLLVVHRADLEAASFPIHGAIAAGVFDTAVFAFAFFITSIVVTDMVRRRDDLLELNRQLAASDAEKQNFTLRATNEINAPFAAIQSYADVILEGYLGQMDPRLREAVEKIRVRSDSLSRMVRQIVQLSNLRTTTFRGEDLQEEDLAAQLEAARERTGELAASRGISVKVEDDAGRYRSQVIPQVFEIMVDNLLTNAMRYSPEGSTVTTSIRRDGGRIAIAVADPGIGIPPEERERIFEEHYRTDEARQVHPYGNGMGLVLVREAVRLHAGEISIDSAPGKGTTFTVTIPVVEKRPEGDAVL